VNSQRPCKHLLAPNEEYLCRRGGYFIYVYTYHTYYRYSCGAIQITLSLRGPLHSRRVLPIIIHITIPSTISSLAVGMTEGGSAGR